MRIQKVALILTVLITVLVAGASSSVARAKASGPLVRACDARTLSASWQNMPAMESSGGFVYLTNRSGAPCDFEAPPQVRLFPDTGQDYQAHARCARCAGAVPVAYRVDTGAGVIRQLVVMPGQRVSLGIQWSNWCGHSIAATPVLDLKLTNKRLPVVLHGPVCVNRSAPSVLSINGSYDLAGGVGVRAGLADLRFLIQSEITSYYYLGVDRHRYGGLCDAFAPFGRPSCGKLAAGYRHTAHVTIDRLAVPLYLIGKGHPHAVYTCVGIQLTARQTDGSITSYGGWYLMKQQVSSIQRTWIDLPGSMILRDGGLAILSRESCQGHVPPAG